MLLFALMLIVGSALLFWLFLFWPWVRMQKEFSDSAYRWRRTVLQALVALFMFDSILWLLLGRPWMLLGWISPPIYFSFMAELIFPFVQFLIVPSAVSLVAAAGCYAIVRTVKYGPFISVSAFCFILAIGLPVWTLYLQHEDIQHLNPDCHQQIGFWQSFAIVGEEFQFSTHVAAVKGNKHYAWSFREMNFYELPENIARNVETCLPESIQR